MKARGFKQSKVQNDKETLLKIQDLNKAQYIALETFRKNGQGVITPVWMAEEKGKLYVWTDANSGKIKRLRNNPSVRLCASDARGTPKSDWIEARARVLEQSDDVKATERRIAAKYGLLFQAFNLVGKLRRGTVRAAIEISATG